MQLINPIDSAHWYRRDGVPRHFVASATGESRPTTLRDARKLGLLPSVTTILGVVAKPELIAWQLEQAVLATLKLPRLAGETDESFVKRIVHESQSIRSSAANFGTVFHQGAERVAHTLEVDATHPTAPWLRYYRDWFQINALELQWSEKVLVNEELGYAGTADLLIEHPVHGLTLVDLKTMRTKPGMEARPYISWCYQLAAYRRALGEPASCLNLIINASEPSVPLEHLWTREEMERGWQAFDAARRLWVVEKNYDPATQGGLVLTAD